MKFYSTDPNSMFYRGEAIRAEFEARPLVQKVANVVATVAEHAPWGRLRSWGSDLHYWAAYGRSRYPGGQVFYR